ncbi:MAG TPA: MFS transporter [Bacteroidia bacterium]
MVRITRTIWVLSIVSMFTDIASEMLYPVMPVYLKSIGFSIVLIGVLEGLAEATAGLSKGYFGKWSDISGKRMPFVRIGYLMSGLSRPIIGLLTHPFWVFIARTFDRFGKGVRTGARDAILSDETTPENKGRIFGFHRSFDTLGAVIGPLLALIYLYFYPGQYRNLFLIAFLPGILSFLATYLIKEKPKSEVPKIDKVNLRDFFSYWKKGNPEYRKLLTGLLTFTLFNSSDVFLLLMAANSGVSDSSVIGLYIFYNLIYALFSYPMGILADRVGMKYMQIAGLLTFALVYLGMTMASTFPQFIGLFFLYGLFSAMTEGNSKAWISNIAAKSDTATAIGTFAGFQSLCLLISSTVAGLIWNYYGPSFTFTLTAIMTVASALYLFILVPGPINVDKNKSA